jgi:hypothetical protein
MATTEQSTTFPAPGSPGSPVETKDRYENFIGGHWVAPVDGEYRDNLSPATGQPICEVAHSGVLNIVNGSRRRSRAPTTCASSRRRSSGRCSR